MANEAEKNVRPEVAAFVNRVQDDLHKKLDIFIYRFFPDCFFGYYVVKESATAIFTFYFYPLRY